MARARTKRRQGTKSKTRLEVVQEQVRDKAVFWDRTSISSFLVLFALIGVFCILIGLYGLSNGELNIGHYFKLSQSISLWRYTTICVVLVLTGINLIMPLPMFWFMAERKTVLICACFLGFNFTIFIYAFVIDVIARSNFFS